MSVLVLSPRITPAVVVLAVALAPVSAASAQAGGPGAVLGAGIIKLPSVPLGVAVDPETDTAFVADSADVAVVDLAASSVTATLPGSDASSVAVDPVTGMAYVTDTDSDSLVAVDGSTDTIAWTTSLAALSRAVYGVTVDPATDSVYVGIDGQDCDSSVAAVNGTTGVVTARITGLCGYPEALALNPQTDTIYAAFSDLSNTLQVISGSTNTITTAVGLTVTPRAVAVNATTGTYYVGAGGSVTAYNGTTNIVTGSDYLAADVVSLDVDPATGSVYATTTLQANSADIINSAATAVLGTIPLANPGWLAADNATNMLAVTDGLQGLAIVGLQSPAIASAATATFRTGRGGSFSIVADGTPDPAVSVSGQLPAGLSVSPAGVLSGIPGRNSGGEYHLTITASNGVGMPAAQALTIIVDQATAFTSADHAAFRAGVRHSFTVRTSGFPAARVTERGKLPRGLHFISRGNGQAILSGKPARSARERRYRIILSATNGTGTGVTQHFTITVQ
jgi:DNA-binding beta-propeller fold protein YncE